VSIAKLMYKSCVSVQILVHSGKSNAYDGKPEGYVKTSRLFRGESGDGYCPPHFIQRKKASACGSLLRFSGITFGVCT
jgi:hypothetical protein